MKTVSAPLIRISSVLALLAVCSGCTGLQYPNTSSGYPAGYGQPNYGGGGYDYDDYRRRREWERREEERSRFEEERRDLEEERRRLERERARERTHRPPPPPRAKPEVCPPGWHPSDSKCSDRERKRGCRDMRTPGGLGCVTGR